MFAKVKSSVFMVHPGFPENSSSTLKAVLKDEQGFVCSTQETKLNQNKPDWEGLNDLPYGIYTLELYRLNRAIQRSILRI